MSIETSSLGTAGFFGRNWWVLLLRGLFAVVLGVLVFTKPFWTLGVVMMAFSFYVLIEGASDLFAAMIGWRHRDDRWLLLLQGIVAIGIGIVTLRTPVITAILLTFLMAAWALATGVLRIIEAVRLRREIQGEVWLMLGGVASVLFALVIMMRPLAGAVAMVRVIGAFALILGMSEVMLSFRVRRARQIGSSTATEPTFRRVA